MRKNFYLFCLAMVLSLKLFAQPQKPPIVTTGPVKYTVTLLSVWSFKSSDGGSDPTEELYGAISVCLAAAGYPATVQLDYTYKNPVDKEIAGGVDPVASLSTNSNGRVLWRQSDNGKDRKITLNSKDKNKNFVRIGSQAVFIFDPKKDRNAAFRLFADMWEADPSEDDEHFNAGKRKLVIPLSEVKPGATEKIYNLEIHDSSSRHVAYVGIVAVQM